jgi:hypothetical protein
MVGGRCQSTPRVMDTVASATLRGPSASRSGAIAASASDAMNGGITGSPVTGSPVTGSPVSSSPVTSKPISRSTATNGRVARGRVALHAGATPFPGNPLRGGASRSSASRAAHAALGSRSAGAPARLEAGAFVPARDVAVVSNLDAAPMVPERSTSARLRDGALASAFNLAQLAAAIAVGIVIGKAAHLIMAGEGAMAWHPTAGAEGGLRAEPSRTPDAARASDAVGASQPLGNIEPRSARNTPRPRSGSAARGSLRANVAVRPAPAATARRAAPCSLASTQPGPALALVPAAACSPLSVDLGPHARPSPRVASPALTSNPAVTMNPALAINKMQPLLAPASDDWLGEQLAILGRAERSLLEDDPESAVRSLEEYQARFPDGLLDPQIASIRQRVEERFTAFIFP